MCLCRSGVLVCVGCKCECVSVSVAVVVCHNTPQWCGKQHQTHTMNTNTSVNMQTLTSPFWREKNMTKLKIAFQVTESDLTILSVI